MAEAKVGFLFKAAAAIPKGQNNHVHNVLQSYYLLRCNETTKGYGLPQQQFSSKSRCTRCFIVWNNNFESRVKPLKLSKKQKQRIKDRKKKRHNNREEIINGNIFEQTCRFCKHTTTTYLAKPDKKIPKVTIDKNENLNNTDKHEKYNKKKDLKTKHNDITDVYCKSMEVFSLKSNKNTLQSAIKKPEKIIKNNKKKKDKFAGLCQKAVLSAAKIKDKNDKQNLMKMFLKPSQ